VLIALDLEKTVKLYQCGWNCFERILDGRKQLYPRQHDKSSFELLLERCAILFSLLPTVKIIKMVSTRRLLK
jgi:hypothetical protein